jgi:hypothetical protein
MSHQTYNTLWDKANREVKDLAELENPTDATIKPAKDFESQRQHLSLLYIRYVQIFRYLDEVYDQMVHPQKRR